MVGFIGERLIFPLVERLEFVVYLRSLIAFFSPMIRLPFFVVAQVIAGAFGATAFSQDSADPAPSMAESEKDLLEDQARIEAGFKEKTNAIDADTKKIASASTLFEGESPPAPSTLIVNLKANAALVTTSLGKVRAEVDAHRDEEQRRLDRVSEIPQLIENLNADKAKDSAVNETVASDSALVDQKIATLQA